MVNTVPRMNGLILMMANKPAGLRMMSSELLIVGAIAFGFMSADVEVVAALFFEGTEAEVAEHESLVLEPNMILMVLVADLYRYSVDP